MESYCNHCCCVSGSGSIFESLRAGCSLLVVVNDALQGNHQVELAEQLASIGLLAYTTPAGLIDTFSKDSVGIAPETPAELGLACH
jgi:UDP-N-acetylglucosamine transferase subunit ALG13